MTSQDMEEDEKQLKRALEDEEEPAGPRRRRRKIRKDKPFGEVFHAITSAAKSSDWKQAMEAFRRARDSEIALPQHLMNTVLYALVGGDTWFETARNIHESDAKSSAMEELEACRDEVLQYMEGKKQMKDEMIYTAQARFSACLGKPDEALDFARQLMNSEIPPKLRVFTPALVGFAQRGNMKRALEIEKMIDACDLDLTELEFKLILTACTKEEGAYPEVCTALKRIGKELTFLQKETIDVARAYFASPNARAAFSEPSLAKKRLWMLDDVRVDAEGFTLAAGESLAASDLEDADWDAFLQAFEELAIRREQKEDRFYKFMKWLEMHGPFPLVVDGANVAFHKQNFDQGAFNFSQIYVIMKHLEKAFPERKALLVLHVNRTKGPLARHPVARDLLSELSERNQLFVTPVGSNDDWYWLYAALKSRSEGFLISNDECRDHIFQLLAPKYFLKWKERHLIRYNFLNGRPTLQLPTSYTSCTQQLTNGTWMLPYRDEEEKETWLCAKPL